MGFRKLMRRMAHGTWVQVQESGAIMAGQQIELDPDYTGDNYAPSPAVREVFTADYTKTTTTETHESRRAE